jgi:outer membrane lipoprotein-sorting protein
MKAICVAVLTLMNVTVGLSQQPSQPTKLESLRGTLIMMMNETEGVASKLWAKGNNTRVDFTGTRGVTVTTIQRGDTMYTFDEISAKGKKERIPEGLATKGLVKQIEEVKKNGKKVESAEIDGETYEIYQYAVSSEELVVVMLSARTSLPRIWTSAIRTGLNRTSSLTMKYRDMEANVNVPDDLFKLPANVKFSEER